MTRSLLRPWQRLARAWREGVSDADMHYGGYRGWRDHLSRLGLTDVKGLRVLDVGCGDRAQLSLLFAADGAKVVAVDRLPVTLGRRRPRMWIALAREEGPAPAFRALARDLVHTVRYWRHLARLRGRSLPFGSVELVRGDAAALSLADGTFDLVVSSAVWEHLPDVEAATREVDRVLSDDGLAVIQIALFPALQGGHHPEWHSPAATPWGRVRPWDHLRPGRLPLPTYLNELRESQYRSVMERCLHVIEWEDGPMRGADLLEAVPRDEVAEYSERDLLLSSITAWAGKAPASMDERRSATLAARPSPGTRNRR